MPQDDSWRRGDSEVRSALGLTTYGSKALLITDLSVVRSKCLRVLSNSTAGGAQVVQDTCTQSNDRSFKFVE